MNWIDIIVLLVLALAVFNGWRQGVILQLFSLAGIVGGIYLASELGEAVGIRLGIDERFASAGGFCIVLIAVILILALTGYIIRKVAKFAGLGVVDSLLGVVVSTVKFVLILSVAVKAFAALNTNYSLVSRATTEDSVAYHPLYTIAENLFPFVKSFGDKIPQITDNDAE